MLNNQTTLNKNKNIKDSLYGIKYVHKTITKMHQKDRRFVSLPHNYEILYLKIARFNVQNAFSPSTLFSYPSSLYHGKKLTALHYAR